MQKVWRIWICGWLLSSVVFANERIFEASQLFQPLATELEAIPPVGFAVVIEFATTDTEEQTLRETRRYYRNGVQVQRWTFSFLPDGRLVGKERVDEEQRILYSETFIYRADRRLWLVLSSQRSYRINRVMSSWQRNQSVVNLLFRGYTPELVAPLSPPEFTLNELAMQQVEEIWEEGKLVRIRYYQYGQLDRVRTFLSNGYEEYIYHLGQAVVRRTVVDNKVVEEELLDEF
jgi:hypothetical protein